MQQEKDFIKREIQRLTIFISRIIGRLQETEIEDLENTLDQVDDELKSEFGFNLAEMPLMPDKTLLEKVKNLSENNVEQLAILLATIADKLDDRDQINKLVRKAIIMLDHVDSMSDTFSIKRMELKNTLKQRL